MKARQEHTRTTDAGDEAPGSITVDLQEGFQEDTVEITVGNDRVYRRAGVSTNWSVGIADTTTVQVPPGLWSLTVAVPTRKLTQTIEVAVSDPVFCTANIVQDELRVEASDSPPPLYF